jgi:NAD(P)-dependent dehydrogenase (short-subunit alcohol dehydrogenase family)
MEARNKTRAVFITGGGSGLGAAIAQHLGALGWRIGIAGRRSDALQATVGKLKIGAQTYPLDVANAEAVDMAIRDFRPDALVCCAAVLGQGSVYEDLTSERFAEVHTINVTGTFNACRSAMRLWRDASVSGDIVNISSLGGIRGMQKFPGFAAYASSKHAIVGLTEALAIEGRPHGVRINAIAPGTLRTPMLEALGMSPKTTPDSIAGTIEFLLDRIRSGPISGTTIEVHCNDD